MSFLSDLHMHTVFSDGLSVSEDYIQEAVKRGFLSIGFSEHSFTAFDLSFCMSEERREVYLKKLPLLKEQYKDKLEIYMGEEFDVFSDKEAENLKDLDYVIGACHYIDVGEEKRAVDHNEKFALETADKYFGGDYAAYAAAYFPKLAELSKIPEVDIIAHFDLVTKFNEGGKYFDENDVRYRDAATSAMEKLSEAGKIFEINTGAITRGYRSKPYPSEYLLGVLHEIGGRITFSSDSHKAENMGAYFDDAIKIAKKCGFSEAFMLYHGEFTPVKI